MIYCVESRAGPPPTWWRRLLVALRLARPTPGGIFRFWTDRQERAEEVAAAGPGRRIRQVRLEQAPAIVRANMLRANPGLTAEQIHG